MIKKIEELRERLTRAEALLDLPQMESEARELKREMSRPDFWNDQRKAADISRQAEGLEKELLKWQSLSKEIRELEELAALADKEGEKDLNEEVEKRYLDLLAQFSDLEFLLLFSEKYDASNAIVSIHAGVGGVDAQDWAQILERMYYRYSEKLGFKAEIIDRLEGQEAGIKSVSFRVSGHFAYGYFKSENGVHRLVRISPFDAESMRHTSFALVEVIPELPESESVEIRDEDLKWEFYHSSGPGGQNVNKTASAVRLIHLPTKISITCQSERSQLQNREIALRVLRAKLKHLEEEKKNKEEKKLKGDVKVAEWGKQIRSYVMQPYQLVKDHRSDYEETDINSVLDGNLEKFSEAYLRFIK
ncbi:MAG TPA: peptide chain release factor 2 [bacterium]|nr:peptide chain release factor 2 [bacterium]HPT29951.1 peptide chain release factor 2 [bacterium]